MTTDKEFEVKMEKPVSYGSNAASPPVLSVASSDLAVVFEWAALLPLAIYLASRRLSHQIIGQTALAGFICMGLFPRLGVLNAIADFLQYGADFLDRASLASGHRRTVWEVNWGSVSPCANGAAIDILAVHLLQKVAVKKAYRDQGKKGQTRPTRYQTLHILDCSDPNPNNAIAQSKTRLGSFSLPFMFELLVLFGLLGICTVAALFGLYGTAAAVFVSILFRISRQLIHVQRPCGYLQSNEGNEPGCMLVALHENASTWYLYTGSRAVIDSLLNNPMVQSITSPLGTSTCLAYFLKSLAVVQLVIITYVAAQKGWDGVALLSLVVVAWVFDSLIYGDRRMAALWLQRQGITIEARSFRFSDRPSMIGTVQMLSGSSTVSWMDGILTPAPRRDAWLSRLGHPTPGVRRAEPDGILNNDDRDWVDTNVEQTKTAVEIVVGSSEAGARNV